MPTFLDEPNLWPTVHVLQMMTYMPPHWYWGQTEIIV